MSHTVKDSIMSEFHDRGHFIVKHGLDALEALPTFIWRTGKGRDDRPRNYDKVNKGDRWIAYAFVESDRRERKLSHVTGFFECIRPAEYRDIPPKALTVGDDETKAWMIEGEAFGKPLAEPVDIGSIEAVLLAADLLPKKLVPRVSVVPISREQFEAIRESVYGRISH
jgi:hypothetical protein